MPPHHASRLTSHEGDIQLALSSLDSNQIQSTRRAAIAFNVPKSTLIDRRAGRHARRDCQPNSKKLSQLEEQVITSYIINLDLRGFAPTYTTVRDIANKLLATRDAGQVSVH